MHISHNCDIVYTIKKTKREHLWLVISSISVGVVAKTNDEVVYVLSIYIISLY